MVIGITFPDWGPRPAKVGKAFAGPSRRLVLVSQRRSVTGNGAVGYTPRRGAASPASAPGLGAHPARPYRPGCASTSLRWVHT